MIGTKYRNRARTVTGIVNILDDDSILLANTSTGSVTINLQKISTENFSTMYSLFVSDISNNASVNSINIVAPNGFTINNKQNYTISTNNGNIKIIVGSNKNYLVINGSGSCCGDIIVSNYNDLYALKTNSQLEQGRYYLMTDFELKYLVEGSTPYSTVFSDSVLLTGGSVANRVIEPIILFANTNHSFNIEAFSTLHTDDVVFYDINDNQVVDSTNTSHGRQGNIFRRIDKIRNIDIAWDWRYKRFTRSQIGGILPYNSSNTYNRNSVILQDDFYIMSTLDNNIGNTNIYNSEYWQKLYIMGSDFASSFGFMGSVSANSYLLQKYFYTFSIEQDSQNKVINASINNTIKNIKINSGDNFIFVEARQQSFEIQQTFSINNIFIENTNNNSILNRGRNGNNSIRFTDNIIKSKFDNNIIGSQFKLNSIGDGFSKNIVDGFFHSNNILNDFNFNFIGFQFNNNVIKNSFYNNFIENIVSNNYPFHFNDISNDFRLNVTKSEFKSNIISNSFTNNIFNPEPKNQLTHNTFGNNCIGNIFNSQMSNNTIGNDFNGCNINTMFRSKIGNNCTFTSATNFDRNILGNYTRGFFGREFQENILGNENFITFGDYCSKNTIGNDNFCTIGNSLFESNIDNHLYNSTIGNNCSNINIGSRVLSTTIGNQCNAINILNNTNQIVINNNVFSISIGNSCSGIELPQLSRYIEIENGVTNISGATQPIKNSVFKAGSQGFNFAFNPISSPLYQEYSKDYLTIEGGARRVRYIDNTDTLIIQDATI
jgi:hypothetical protein